jgi:hypothetical protein
LAYTFPDLKTLARDGDRQNAAIKIGQEPLNSVAFIDDHDTVGDKRRHDRKSRQPQQLGREFVCYTRSDAVWQSALLRQLGCSRRHASSYRPLGLKVFTSLPT